MQQMLVAFMCVKSKYTMVTVHNNRHQIKDLEFNFVSFFSGSSSFSFSIC